MDITQRRWDGSYMIDLLPEEKSRVKDILNELKDIYCADAVAMHMDTTIATKTNVYIDIFGAVNPGNWVTFG